MKRAGELRQRAERHQRLKRQITDPTAVQAITDLAGKYEMTAAELESRHHTPASALTRFGSNGVACRDAIWNSGSPLNGS
jgi:hypothetical protein